MQYEPTLSVEENNRRNLQSSGLLQIQLPAPRSAVMLEDIVDRTILLRSDTETVRGKVAAVFLDGDGTTSDFVRLKIQVGASQSADHLTVDTSITVQLL